MVIFSNNLLNKKLLRGVTLLYSYTLYIYIYIYTYVYIKVTKLRPVYFSLHRSWSKICLRT